MEDDGIRIMDDPVEVEGIRDVSPPVKPVPVPVVPSVEATWRSKQVYFYGGKFLCQDGGARHILVSTGFQYVNQYEVPLTRETQAVAREINGNVVIASSEENLKTYEVMLEQVSVYILPERYLFFTANNWTTHISGGYDNICVINYDQENKVVSYLSRYSQVKHLHLASPMTQDQKELYDHVSRFITGCTAGVRNEIAVTKNKLADVNHRRSEEVYLYVSDFTPPPGKEELHNTIISKLETDYESDASELQVLKQTLSGHEAQIKSARSQLPTGAKGVSIRTAYCKSPILHELLDGFKVKRFARRRQTEVLVDMDFAEDLILSDEDDDGNEIEVYYGRPRIQITFNSNRATGRDGTFVHRVTGESLDRGAFVHPHLQGTERWCLGTYVTPIQNAFLGGNWPLLVSLTWQFLNRYNADSPLLDIARCAEVMRTARPNELIVRRK